MNVQWFRGVLVFKAHRLVYHSNLDSKVIKKKEKLDCPESTLSSTGQDDFVGATSTLGAKIRATNERAAARNLPVEIGGASSTVGTRPATATTERAGFIPPKYWSIT